MWAELRPACDEDHVTIFVGQSFWSGQLCNYTDALLIQPVSAWVCCCHAVSWRIDPNDSLKGNRLRLKYHLVTEVWSIDSIISNPKISTSFEPRSSPGLNRLNLAAETFFIMPALL